MVNLSWLISWLYSSAEPQDEITRIKAWTLIDTSQGAFGPSEGHTLLVQPGAVYWGLAAASVPVVNTTGNLHIAGQYQITNQDKHAFGQNHAFSSAHENFIDIEEHGVVVIDDTHATEDSTAISWHIGNFTNAGTIQWHTNGQGNGSHTSLNTYNYFNNTGTGVFSVAQPVPLNDSWHLFSTHSSKSIFNEGTLHVQNITNFTADTYLQGSGCVIIGAQSNLHLQGRSLEPHDGRLPWQGQSIYLAGPSATLSLHPEQQEESQSLELGVSVHGFGPGKRIVVPEPLVDYEYSPETGRLSFTTADTNTTGGLWIGDDYIKENIIVVSDHEEGSSAFTYTGTGHQDELPVQCECAENGDLLIDDQRVSTPSDDASSGGVLVAEQPVFVASGASAASYQSTAVPTEPKVTSSPDTSPADILPGSRVWGFEECGASNNCEAVKDEALPTCGDRLWDLVAIDVARCASTVDFECICRSPMWSTNTRSGGNDLQRAADQECSQYSGAGWFEEVNVAVQIICACHGGNQPCPSSVTEDIGYTTTALPESNTQDPSTSTDGAEDTTTTEDAITTTNTDPDVPIPTSDIYATSSATEDGGSSDTTAPLPGVTTSSYTDSFETNTQDPSMSTGEAEDTAIATETDTIVPTPTSDIYVSTSATEDGGSSDTTTPLPGVTTSSNTDNTQDLSTSTAEGEDTTATEETTMATGTDTIVPTPTSDIYVTTSATDDGVSVTSDTTTPFPDVTTSSNTDILESSTQDPSTSTGEAEDTTTSESAHETTSLETEGFTTPTSSESQWTPTSEITSDASETGIPTSEGETTSSIETTPVEPTSVTASTPDYSETVTNTPDIESTLSIETTPVEPTSVTASTPDYSETVTNTLDVESTPGIETTSTDLTSSPGSTPVTTESTTDYSDTATETPDIEPTTSSETTPVEPTSVTASTPDYSQSVTTPDIESTPGIETTSTDSTPSPDSTPVATETDVSTPSSESTPGVLPTSIESTPLPESTSLPYSTPEYESTPDAIQTTDETERPSETVSTPTVPTTFITTTSAPSPPSETTSLTPDVTETETTTSAEEPMPTCDVTAEDCDEVRDRYLPECGRIGWDLVSMGIAGCIDASDYHCICRSPIWNSSQRSGDAMMIQRVVEESCDNYGAVDWFGQLSLTAQRVCACNEGMQPCSSDESSVAPTETFAETSTTSEADVESTTTSEADVESTTTSEADVESTTTSEATVELTTSSVPWTVTVTASGTVGTETAITVPEGAWLMSFEVVGGCGAGPSDTDPLNPNRGGRSAILTGTAVVNDGMSIRAMAGGRGGMRVGGTGYGDGGSFVNLLGTLSLGYGGGAGSAILIDNEPIAVSGGGGGSSGTTGLGGTLDRNTGDAGINGWDGASYTTVEGIIAGGGYGARLMSQVGGLGGVVDLSSSSVGNLAQVLDGGQGNGSNGGDGVCGSIYCSGSGGGGYAGGGAGAWVGGGVVQFGAGGGAAGSMFVQSPVFEDGYVTGMEVPCEPGKVVLRFRDTISG